MACKTTPYHLHPGHSCLTIHMTCYHSKPAWKTGLPNENGKHPIRFGFRSETPDYFIDCGKCEGCRVKQRRDWAIRMYHESQFHEYNSFLTMTYNDQNLPQDGKINKRDIQLFLKRLRAELDNKIRYYIVGEYGDQTQRPHYHACIFGQDFRGPNNYFIRDRVWGNPHLDRIWKLGHLEIAEFNLATAMYTAGYVTKKAGAADTFSLQSRNPPLGKNWVRKYHDQLRRVKSVPINGKEHPIPSIYLRWLEGTETQTEIKEALSDKIIIYNDKQLRNKKLNQIRNTKLLRKTKI